MEKLQSIIGVIAEDCSNVAALPNITLQFGGVGFLMTPEEYVLRLPHDDYNTTTVCTSALQGFDSSGGILPLWLIGTSFLRVAYTVYNLENGTVSMAAALA